jgi:hypothetical protein
MTSLSNDDQCFFTRQSGREVKKSGARNRWTSGTVNEEAEPEKIESEFVHIIPKATELSNKMLVRVSRAGQSAWTS